MSTVIIADRPRQAGALRATRITAPRTARIGLLGCGVVGREVARALLESGQEIGRRAGRRGGHREGRQLELSRILVRHLGRERGINSGLFTADFNELLDGEPDVIIELLGGVEPAATYVEAALARGIPVVTANKSLIARHGARLASLAEAHGTALACEACVGGAIPVLASLAQLAGDRVQSIRGVLNGSCNYILTSMARDDRSLDEAVGDAIRLGLAEPDPAADLSGRDSAEKLCVLAAAAGFAGISPDDVATEGIERITKRDIAAAKSFGCVIKLIAELEICDGLASLRVGPALVAPCHPLARPDGPENALVISSELGGTLLLQGIGAGPRPTTSAVLGDVLRVLRGEGTAFAAPVHQRASDCRAASGPLRRYFLRVQGPHEKLTPARMFETLRAHGITARQIEFQCGRFEAMTGEIEPARIASLRRALNEERSVSMLAAPVIDCA